EGVREPRGWAYERPLPCHRRSHSPPAPPHAGRSRRTCPPRNGSTLFHGPHGGLQAPGNPRRGGTREKPQGGTGDPLPARRHTSAGSPGVGFILRAVLDAANRAPAPAAGGGAPMIKAVSLEVELKSPVDGHRFQFRMQPDPSWSVVVDCEVLEVEKPRRLSYTWVVAAQSHHTTVTWTLAPTEGGGTRLHLQQSGFRSDSAQEFGGAKAGWRQMLAKLQELLAA